jgi:phosphoribosylformimino-5-aminoimidazole carboxamide ribotide isomerase
MIELIPAIDLIDGKCVRLTQGDYTTRKVYDGDPLDVAKRFEDCGIRRLHVVDLDGARTGHIIHHRTLERLAIRTSLLIDYGGGLTQDEDLRIAFEHGAHLVTGGSIAVKNPGAFASWIATYGSKRILLGADARDRKIAVGGWKETTGEDLIPFIRSWHEKGIVQVISTDIRRDGMLQGPATEMYREIRREVPLVYLIASGGIASVQDIEQLEEANIPAVIFGKAFYEGQLRPEDLLRFTGK